MQVKHLDRSYVAETQRCLIRVGLENTLPSCCDGVEADSDSLSLNCTKKKKSFSRHPKIGAALL